MPYVQVAGTRLYYTETGPSTGRPLLLLHAALQTGESMAPLRALLEPLGLRVVMPDQRGHGRSANPGGGLTIAGLADDMVTLMAELGLERPLVVGYSLGGIVAIELARRGLVSGLVVMASRIHPAEAGSRAFDPEDIRKRSPVWAGQLQAKHEEPWEALATEIGASLQRWPGFAADDLGAIGCPVLVVQGDKDQMVPVEQARELAAAVPGAKLQVVPRAGHPELLYRPDAMEAVKKFVAAQV
ncbi:MAG: putative esterase [Firmicutes bacterium]|nr:putative esterase [Bacillota bacterium]